MCLYFYGLRYLHPVMFYLFPSYWHAPQIRTDVGYRGAVAFRYTDVPVSCVNSL